MQIIKFLLGKGADVHAETVYGERALNWAKNEEVKKNLQSYGATYRDASGGD